MPTLREEYDAAGVVTRLQGLGDGDARLCSSVSAGRETAQIGVKPDLAWFSPGHLPAVFSVSGVWVF
jgi:hypothetical protein